MRLIAGLLSSLLCAEVAHSFISRIAARGTAVRLGAGNADLFGGGEVKGGSRTPQVTTASVGPARYADEAARLRQEAAEMEMALREEARSKGVPEEMINKLIPLRGPKGVAPAAASDAATAAAADPVQVAAAAAAAIALATPRTPAELRAELGYFPTGDAVRFTQQLDRLKAKGIIRGWNSKAQPMRGDFSVTQTTFKMKTGLEPQQLKLDSAGFDYAKVLGLAVAGATVCALASNQVGGQAGFLLGYASALFPVLLIGVGSIAPGLIADVLNKVTFATDSAAKSQHVSACAGKFFVGYIMGLPLSSFSPNSGSGNTCEFFQLRPEVVSGAEDEGSSGGGAGQKMFAKAEYSQFDIARSSAASIAGCVAECFVHKEASGRSTPADVAVLYDVMNAVMPALAPEKQQDHIRWSAVTAWDILEKNKSAYEALSLAFAEGQSLEECVAVIESNLAR